MTGAGFVFRLGNLELTEYCQMNPDAKFDPYGAPWLQPSFTETPYADGQPLISTTVENREMMIPLFLNEPTKEALHELIQKINIAIGHRPLEVEWQDSEAPPTFYEVNFARFEPDYNFRRSQHQYAAGTLHIWVSGYGTTGTRRIIATGAGTGIFISLPVPSLGGDSPALLDTTITAGAVVPSLGRIVAIGAITQPSYSALVPAASLLEAQPGATLTGASGAQGSQYLGLPVSPTGGASGVACRVPLQNPTIMGGDNRVLAVVNSNITAGIGINAYDPYGNSMGATAIATAVEGWSIIDLGVCRLPTLGPPTLPRISIQAGAIWASGQPGPAISASPGLALNEIIVLPDKNLSLVLENIAGGTVLSRSAFPGLVRLLGSNDEVGNPWAVANNNANTVSQGTGLNIYSLGGAAALEVTAKGLDANRIAGILSDSLLIRGRPILAGGASEFNEVRLFKDVQPSQFVQARFAASGFLALEAATGTATGNTLASTALASLTAGNQYIMSLLLHGPNAAVNVSRVDGAPMFAPASVAVASIGVASNAAIAGGGAPAFGLYQGRGLGESPQMRSWEVTGIPTSNLAAYDSYRIDGPEADVYRTGSGGAFAGQKLVAQMRGAFPKAQPSTSIIAIVCAPFDQGVGNDKITAEVRALERFFYAR